MEDRFGCIIFATSETRSLKRFIQVHNSKTDENMLYLILKNRYVFSPPVLLISTDDRAE